MNGVGMEEVTVGFLRRPMGYIARKADREPLEVVEALNDDVKECVSTAPPYEVRGRYLGSRFYFPEPTPDWLAELDRDGEDVALLVTSYPYDGRGGARIVREVWPGYTQPDPIAPEQVRVDEWTL